MEQDRIIHALTRSIPSSDYLALLSEEELLRQLVGAHAPPSRLRLLASISRVLKLMDALLTGSDESLLNAHAETGFVWQLEREWIIRLGSDEEALASDPDLDTDLEWFEEYHDAIQLYCHDAKHREEEGLLFGPEELRRMTRQAYARLREAWLRSIRRGSG